MVHIVVARGGPNVAVKKIQGSLFVNKISSRGWSIFFRGVQIFQQNKFRGVHIYQQIGFWGNQFRGVHFIITGTGIFRILATLYYTSELSNFLIWKVRRKVHIIQGSCMYIVSHLAWQAQEGMWCDIKTCCAKCVVLSMLESCSSTVMIRQWSKVNMFARDNHVGY